METQITVNCKVEYEYHNSHVMEVGKFLNQVVYIREGSDMIYQNENVVSELSNKEDLLTK